MNIETVNGVLTNDDDDDTLTPVKPADYQTLSCLTNWTIVPLCKVVKSG